MPSPKGSALPISLERTDLSGVSENEPDEDKSEDPFRPE